MEYIERGMFAVIKYLHRDSDLYVIFGAKKENGLCNVGKIESNRLALPKKTINNLLSKDSYFTPNSFDYLYRSENETTEKENYPGLKWATRKTRTKSQVERVNAIYVDLDLGRDKNDLTVAQALSEIPSFLNLHYIPAPSIIAESGRGLYLMWRICSVESGRQLGEKATKSNQELHKNICKSLVDLFKRYKADSYATLVTQYFRIPGSYHSKAKKEVRYSINYEAEDYSLKEFAEILEIPVTTKQSKPPASGIENQRQVPKRANGPKAKCATIFEDIEKILKYHGPIHKRGSNNSKGRRNFLEIVAWVCKGARKSKEETLNQLKIYASEKCIPSFPSDNNDTSLSGIVQTIYACKKLPEICRWSHEGLAKHFNINHDQALKFDLQFIFPLSVKEHRNSLKHQKSMELEEKLKERQNIVKGVLLSLQWNSSLSLNEIHQRVSAALKHARVHSLSKESIRKACKKWGIKIKDRGRPRKHSAEVIYLDSRRTTVN